MAASTRMGNRRIEPIRHQHPARRRLANAFLERAFESALVRWDRIAAPQTPGRAFGHDRERHKRSARLAREPQRTWTETHRATQERAAFGSVVTIRRDDDRAAALQ